MLAAPEGEGSAFPGSSMWISNGRSRWLAPALGLLALGGNELRPHVRRLSPAMSGALASDVKNFAVSPDGDWLVYRADMTQDERFELYAVPADASAPPRPLCGTIAAERDVDEFRFTPDGVHVVYRVSASLQEGELFAVRLDGATPPVRLHGDLQPGRSVFSFDLSPDGQRVVFLGDLRQQGLAEVYSAPIDAAQPAVPLNGTLRSGAFVERIAPDSRSVLYLARQDTDQLELYTVPIEGGPSLRLSDLGPNRGVQADFRIAPDSRTVVFRADARVDEQIEVFAVPVDGSAAPVCLNGPLNPEGDVEGALEIDETGARALFRIEAGSSGPGELYSAPLDGSAPALRLDASTFGAGVQGFLRLVPGRGRVLYIDRSNTLPLEALYSVPVDGSAPPARLGLAPVGTFVGQVEVSRDGARVVFSRSTTSSLVELFAVDSDGAAPAQQLDVAPWAAYNPEVFRLGAGRVLYAAHRAGRPERELFSAPLDGSTGPMRLLTFAPFGDLQPDIAPAGTSVAYRMEANFEGVTELLLLPQDGSAPPRSLSGPGALFAVGDVQSFALAGRRAIYLADQEVDGIQELFSADLERGGAPVKLNGPLGPDRQDVFEFVVSPDGAAVAFRANPNVIGRHELFLVPSDGRAPPRKIDTGTGTNSGVKPGFRFSPDGRWVVFLSDERVGFQDVYAAPSDGSASARRVLTNSSGDVLFEISPDSTRVVARNGIRHHHGSLRAAPLDGSAPEVFVASVLWNSDIKSFSISADSSRVAYCADALIDDRPQLFSASITGEGFELLLQDPQGGWVPDVAAAGADGRVVFRAYGPEGRLELYSVPADGSALPRKLAPMGPGRRVKPFLLSPDGTRVAYRADADVDERFELWCAPVDGSAPPVKLSFGSRRDTDVPAFAFTPDSTRVLFLADILRNEQHDLYVVPADRSAAPRRLNPSLAPSGGTVSGFACSPDGESVAYRSNHEDQAATELFLVPLDGSAPPVRMNAPVVEGGGVRAFRFAGPGELVFDGDVREDEVFELFTSVLAQRRKPAEPPR